MARLRRRQEGTTPRPPVRGQLGDFSLEDDGKPRSQTFSIQGATLSDGADQRAIHGMVGDAWELAAIRPVVPRVTTTTAEAADLVRTDIAEDKLCRLCKGTSAVLAAGRTRRSA
jgi:hypothetical protein